MYSSFAESIIKHRADTVLALLLRLMEGEAGNAAGGNGFTDLIACVHKWCIIMSKMYFHLFLSEKIHFNTRTQRSIS